MDKENTWVWSPGLQSKCILCGHLCICMHRALPGSVLAPPSTSSPHSVYCLLYVNVSWRRHSGPASWFIHDVTFSIIYWDIGVCISSRPAGTFVWTPAWHKQEQSSLKHAQVYTYTVYAFVLVHTHGGSAWMCKIQTGVCSCVILVGFSFIRRKLTHWVCDRVCFWPEERWTW